MAKTFQGNRRDNKIVFYYTYKIYNKMTVRGHAFQWRCLPEKYIAYSTENAEKNYKQKLFNLA